jgi:hypothetical protein
MGLFDKLTNAVGIGGAKVELGIEAGLYQEGGFATGTVLIRGGKSEQRCNAVLVEVKQWIEKTEVINGEIKDGPGQRDDGPEEPGAQRLRHQAGQQNTPLTSASTCRRRARRRSSPRPTSPGAIDPSATAKLEVGPGQRGFLPRSLLTRVEGKPGATEINRIGGKPIGIDPRNWPMHEGKAMSHLLTIDLHTLDLPFVPKNRALAVFCINPEHNDAFEAGNPYTRVVLISPSDLKRGEANEVPNHPEVPAFRLQVSPLTQQDAWTYFGGAPKWLQGDPAESADFSEGLQHSLERGGFYCQFNENLVPMNLGDSGVMYVFERTAFWQCH